MTAAQWIEAVKLYNSMWRNNPLPKDTIDAWYKHLAHLPGRRVWDAINHLADTADYPPDLKAVKATCAKLARDEQMAAPLDRPALPAGQTRWDRLTDDERAPYIDQAFEAWHGYATRRDSPPVVGLARHYAMTASGATRKDHA